jgi:hypothetical protein
MRSARLRLGLMLGALLALAAFVSPAAYAGTEWVGGASNGGHPEPNWSAGGNFTDVGSGDELIFPQLSTNAVACSSTKACYKSHNDASDTPNISVDAGTIKFDDGRDYEVTGSAIELDSGFLAEPDAEIATALNGVVGVDCSEWAIPLALTAEQTWRFKGPDCGTDFKGTIVDGAPSDHFPLTIDLGDSEAASSYTGGLALESTVAVGNIVVNGENSAVNPKDNGIFSFGVPFSTEEPGSLDFPGAHVPSYESQGTSLTLNTTQWEGAGESTAITSVDSDASIGNQFEETGQSASLIFVPKVGQLHVNGDVTFKAGSTAKPGKPERNHLYFFVAGEDSPAVPGVDYSQLSATGKVHLDGAADLGDYSPEGQSGASIYTSLDGGSDGLCESLPVGAGYTLIHADEGITGEFANAPQGARVPISSLCDLGGAGGGVPVAQTIEIGYDADDVTATVVDAPESEFEFESETEPEVGGGNGKEPETTGGGSSSPPGEAPVGPLPPAGPLPAGPTLPVVLPAAPMLIPPPNTAIGKVKIAKNKAKVTFNGTGFGKLTFLCRLDKAKKEKPCSSPETLSKLSPGKHTLHVRAVDSRGVSDPTPASISFKIKP